jgi:hypothetical protein
LLALILMVGLAVWGVTRMGQGEVIIGDREIVVKTKAHTLTVDLADIVRAAVTTLESEGGLDAWTRRLGFDTRVPFVKIELDRSIHVSLFRARYGTDVAGIPVFRSRATGVYVDDPQALVDAIREACERDAAHVAALDQGDR